MAVQRVGALTRKVLRDDVYDVVLQMIMTREFPPGANLSIESIARQLGVSPTPVREALVNLEGTGLVQRAALKGYRVSPPLSAAAMAELVDARRILEVAAVERAADHPDDIAPALRAAHTEHEAVVRTVTGKGEHEPEDPDLIFEYFRADWNFHRTILHGCGNRFFEAMAENLGAHVHRMRQTLGAGLWDANLAVREHAEILAAFEAGDKARAVAAMQAHLQHVRERSLADTAATDQPR